MLHPQTSTGLLTIINLNLPEQRALLAIPLFR